MVDDYEHALALWWAGRTQDERNMFSHRAIDKNDRRCFKYLTNRERLEWAYSTHADVGPRLREALGRRYRALCEVNAYG